MKNFLSYLNGKTSFILMPTFRILFVVCFTMFGISTFGQTSIWTNPITGTNPGSSNPYTTGDVKNTNISVSGIGRTGVTNIAANNVYNGDVWGTTATINTGKYYSFTLTPATGYKISLSSFVYTGTRETGSGSNAGPTSFALRSDANSDNYASNIGTPSAAGTTISLSASAYQDLSTATGFRYYAWNAGGNGEYSINAFTFNGSVLGSDSTTLSFGSNSYGTAAVQTFQVNGNGLNPTSATVTINGSTNYEVSTTSSSSGFGATATLTASSGSLSSANVWVRLKTTSAVGAYNENITFGGGGVTGVTIACSGTVTTATLTLTGETANNKTYDGLTTATLSGTAVYSGLQNGESFTVTGTPTASFATATVGKGITVTVIGYTAPSSNYTVSQPSLSADITPATLTVSADDATKCYGSVYTLGTTTFTTSGLVLGETIGNVTLTSAGAASGAASGSYAIVPSAAIGGIFTASNYDVIYIDGSLDVLSTPTAGSIGPSQSVCINVIPSPLTSEIDGGGVGNLSYRWEQNTNLTTPSWSTISGETTATYAPGSLVQTTQYRRITISTLNAVACESIPTPVIQVTVIPKLNAGTISGEDVTVCSGTNIPLKVDGADGNIQWYYSTTKFGYYRPIWGQTSETLERNFTGNNFSYFFVEVSDQCSTTVKYSNKIAVRWLSPVAGVISGAGTVCTGGARTLTLGSNVGTVQWQSSTDNGVSVPFADVVGATGTTYTTDALTIPTYYRVVVIAGVCGSATSAAVLVNVSSPAEAGSIPEGDIDICKGSSAPLTLTGNTAGVIAWYKSVNATSITPTWTLVSGQTTDTLTSGILSVTTWYKARVTNGSCIDETPIVKVMVNPTSVVRTISGTGTICNGSSRLLTLGAGSIGTLQWQSSTTSATANDFASIIGATSQTYLASPIITTWYRVVSTNGVCSSATSAAVAVTVSQPTSVGTLTALATTLCKGIGTTLSLSSTIGTIAWQKATVSASGVIGTYAVVAGNVSTTLVTGNLTATTAYKVVVSSGVCSTSTSVPMIIAVSPTSVVKTITGAGAICNGGSKTLTLATGSVGTLQWQSSTTSANAADFTNIDGATSLTYVASPISPTWYRVVSTSGACSSATSAAVAVTASQPLSVGNITALDGTVCAGSGTTLTLSATKGTIAWQKAAVTNGEVKTFDAVSGNTSATLVTGNLKSTTAYRIIVSGGLCTSAISNVVIVSVSPEAKVGPIIGFNKTANKACVGTPKTLTLGSGYVGTIEWLSSPTLTGTYTVIPGATASSYDYTPTNTGVMYFKVRMTSSPCFTPAISTTGVAVYADNCSSAREAAKEEDSEEFKAISYPNPSASVFQIEVSTPSSVKKKIFNVQVYDMVGRFIEQRQVQQSENIEIGNDYASGMYSIIVTQGEQVKTLRVIKK